jgi:hypothetical protein
MAGPGRVMAGFDELFSSSYAQARERFLQAAGQAGLAVESRVHPMPGLEGEVLAMDVARHGRPDADRVLIVSSACHGVEGFCGSGVQVSALRDAQWLDHASRADVALVFIHALNPYGFSHIRRTTHENVDLNRNFHDFSKPLPVNLAYREIHPLLLPGEWPPSGTNTASIASYVATHGAAAWQSAMTGGQYEFPDGLFFGGNRPTWSNLALREVLRAHGQRAGHIAWIDIHTGLGPSGWGERIYAGPNDEATVARARQWWGGEGATPVTSIYDGSSSSAFLTGLMWSAVAEECTQAQYTGIAMEYGTVPLSETLQALRAEHWLQLHPEAPPALAAGIKKQFKDTFYTDTDEWKAQVLRQARQALFQAADGLNG